MSAVQASETRNSDRTESVQVADKEYVHDSIYIFVKGDTVRETCWRTLWREQTVHDTVIERHTDTIVKTETVEKVVTKTSEDGKVGWIVALALFSIILIYILIKILLKTH